MDRVAVFIDGGYLDHVLVGELGGVRLDYQAFSVKLAAEDKLLRTYYYHCEPWQSNPPTEDEKKRFANAQRFHNALKRLSNYEVRLGRLAYRGRDEAGNPILEQKGVDTMLSVDLLSLSADGNISKAFLITNDSDFIPVVQFSKNKGVQVVLVHGQKPQTKLRDAVDDRIELDAAYVKDIVRK